MSQLVEDLDQIGHLDHDPACEVDAVDCDKTATWWVDLRHLCCDRHENWLLCTEHKQHAERYLERLAFLAPLGMVQCGFCGATRSAFRLIIRPLNGGEQR